MKRTKDKEPNQPPETYNLTFDEAMHKIANVPKAEVDEKMKQAKAKNKAKRKPKQ